MLPDLFYRMRSLLRRQDVEDELQDELHFHLEREAQKYRDAGVPEEEAHRRARIAIGGAEQARQQCREARGTRLVEDLWQDLCYGARSIWKSRIFTVITVLTLALGIGSCTAIFSIVNAVLIRSLPYGNAERLVNIFTPNPHMNIAPIEAFCPSFADFFDLKREMVSFSSMSAFEPAAFSSVGEETSIRVGGANVDGSFFSTLQSSPVLGRAIEPTDDQPGHNHVVVISYPLWQSMFGGSNQVLGKSLRLNGSSYQIIGVMPPAFAYPHETDFPPGVLGDIGRTDVWVPLALSPQQKADRDNFDANVIARLRPGVSIQRAQAEMSALMVQLNLLHQGDLRGWGAYVKPFRDSAIGSVRRLMWILLAAVSLVLFIACGNAANLLLARAAGRTHELGVRATMGASKGRIIRQMLTESLLLALIGGFIGTGLAYIFLRGLVRLSPGDIPRLDEASIDFRVLGFSLLISLLTSVFFGIVPSLFASRLNLISFLKSGGNRGCVGAGNHLRSTLIVGELSLVVILLTSAGLLIRSYLKVQRVQVGFSTSTVSADLQLDEKYRNGEQMQAFYRTLLEKVGSIPGISSSGLINALPLSRNQNVSGFYVEGYANQKEQLVQDKYATPQYFAAMGIPIVKGRAFADADKAGQPLVIVINQAFEARYFGGREPIGLRMQTSGPGKPWRTIIGVVGNVRQTSLEAAPVPEVYEPLSQTANDIDGDASLVVRSSLPPNEVMSDVRVALKAIDPDLALGNLQTMGDLVTAVSAQRRFQTALLSLFAAMAMFLGMVGIYGLLAYSVKERSSEIGIRVALGASRSQVLGMFLRQGLTLTVLGLFIGLTGAWIVTRLLTSLLYGVSALDPITFVAVPGVLLIVAITACLVPAGRATTVDPMNVLRSE
jgi:predicted permease